MQKRNKVSPQECIHSLYYANKISNKGRGRTARAPLTRHSKIYVDSPPKEDEHGCHS
jgi:hypothetical protein